MSENSLTNKIDHDIVWYEDEISIRGCALTLPQVRSAYRELTTLTKKEGRDIISGLIKPDDMDEAEFQERNNFLSNDAFKLTISIIGFDGQTVYGETEDVFDTKNLPIPIKTIYFTNINAFKRHASGNQPENRFSVWLHFDKPPLFDTNNLVSEPTPNASNIEVTAKDVVFFRAVQNITATKLNSKKLWYSFIHSKFVYDVALWFFALPMGLYFISIYTEKLFSGENGKISLKIAFFLYAIGMYLFAYRTLFWYIKWAFPVNILEENKDNATAHRVLLGTILLSLILTAINVAVGLA